MSVVSEGNAHTAPGESVEHPRQYEVVPADREDVAQFLRDRARDALAHYHTSR